MGEIDIFRRFLKEKGFDSPDSRYSDGKILEPESEIALFAWLVLYHVKLA